MRAIVKLLATACAVAFAVGGSAGAQDKPIELKLSHWAPPSHVNQGGVFGPWAKMVEEKSGGRLKITIFPGGVLGKPADHWDLAQNGIVDIAWARTTTPRAAFL